MSRRRPRNDAPPRATSKGSRRDETAPRRRRLGTFTKVVLVVAITLSGLALTGSWVLRQSYFRVQHVTLLGVRHEPVGQVLAASGLESHPTMLSVSASSIERNLASFTWIESVTITKRWPSTVVVAVHEGTPVAVAFNARHVLQYVDRSGRDLGVAPIDANLPTLQYVDPATTTWPFERAGVSAPYVASRLPRAFSSQVSVITVDAKGDVTIKLTTPVTFVLGPPAELKAKLVAIASVIAHTTLHPGDVVDVTVPDELAVSGPAPS